MVPQSPDTTRHIFYNFSIVIINHILVLRCKYCDSSFKAGPQTLSLIFHGTKEEMGGGRRKRERRAWERRGPRKKSPPNNLALNEIWSVFPVQNMVHFLTPSWSEAGERVNENENQGQNENRNKQLEASFNGRLISKVLLES